MNPDPVFCLVNPGPVQHFDIIEQLKLFRTFGAHQLFGQINLISVQFIKYCNDILSLRRIIDASFDLEIVWFYWLSDFSLVRSRSPLNFFTIK